MFSSTSKIQLNKENDSVTELPVLKDEDMLEGDETHISDAVRGARKPPPPVPNSHTLPLDETHISDVVKGARPPHNKESHTCKILKKNSLLFKHLSHHLVGY